ncbi:hypothetical protein VMCG_05349 [Cytospora schulzeri]|uniref:Enterotoxin n=1 Tax=Cytospora schulzeri TaxID=448051 RepID=A0A423WKD5_9PEZI|nr:hypothetical protein VMCG_05349 [Valsa malicola]
MAQLLRFLAVASSAALATTTASASHYPDAHAAHQNAFALFNSIHSAMRQWGSSLNHNGMSFYLATAPEGSIFYHGDYTPKRPESFEWLAFEIEHASQFAQSWEPRNPYIPNTPEKKAFDGSLADVLRWHQTSHHLPLSDMPNEHRPFVDITPPQRPISTFKTDDPSKDPPKGPPGFDKPMRGYFQVYRTNRPLNLLYIDGEAAAKCPLGPLDSQDLILLDWDAPKYIFGEWQRATDLCALANEWAFPSGGKIDGFIRMEAGFEIIQCDFSTTGGLDLVSVQASSFRNESGTGEEYLYDPAFEWMRAASARYHGHPAGRLEVDWSSMVSAYAYPVNLSNPDWSRQDLPRVLNATREGRRNIRGRLRQVIAERGGKNAAEKGIVNWQAVADKIVTRFSERLWYLANGQVDSKVLLSNIGTVINPFISYTDHSSKAEHLAIDRCTKHYLDPITLNREAWTPEDHIIAAAVERVSYSICDGLFSARSVLRANSTSLPDIGQPVEQAQAIVRQLIEKLRWSTWKQCGRCPSPDEVCLIPMFPFGGMDDYVHPSCKNMTRVLESNNYWGLRLR